jgi:hypothetical protein
MFLCNSATISSKLSFRILTISSASSRTRNLVFKVYCFAGLNQSNVQEATICVGEANRSICGLIGIPPQVLQLREGILQIF